MTDPNKPADEPKLAKNETIKADSNLLRLSLIHISEPTRPY